MKDKWYRVYFDNGIGSPRGAVKKDGKLSVSATESIYYNPLTGAIIHDHDDGKRESYFVSKLPGNYQSVTFFPAEYNCKELDVDELFIKWQDTQNKVNGPSKKFKKKG